MLPVTAEVVSTPLAITPVNEVAIPVNAEATLRKLPMNRQFWILMFAPETGMLAAAAVV
jgi:hypothetical protein